MTTPAADGPVWRDRGAIIAQQQTRIAELEADAEYLRGCWALSEDQHDATYDEMSRRIAELEDERDAARAELAALRGRIEALADRWRSVSVAMGPGATMTAAEAFADASDDLRAALAAAPAVDTTPAAPHAEDGATGTLAERLAKIEGVSPAVASVRAMMRAELSTAISAPVADPSGDTEGGQA